MFRKETFSANLHCSGTAEAGMRGEGGSGAGVFHDNLMLSGQMFLPEWGKGLWRELFHGGVDLERSF